MADFRLERALLKKGFRLIAGIDEVGRGALFGPVVSVSVVFPPELIARRTARWLKEIDDSKRLSPKKRNSLASQILVHASAVGIGFASPLEIDRINIYHASLAAMKRAVAAMQTQPDFLLIDGFALNDVHYLQQAVTHGDRKSTVIAAASILAKVLRDALICGLDSDYAGYGLKQHKGYATLRHYQALNRLGPTDLHRRSFRLLGTKRN